MFWQKIKQYPFFIRLTNIEYWNTNILYFPVFFYWLYLAIRMKTPFFFTSANPSIETGGMLGESKMDILNKIPTKYKPKDIFIKHGTPISKIKADMDANNIVFPIIIKPDIGERGTKVEKIDNDFILDKYLKKNPYDSILQTYIDFEEELAILYYYYPNGNMGKITSVTQKEFLSVVGNGINNNEELLLQNPRGILQIERLRLEKPELLKEIPELNKYVKIEPIGNHSKGTKFINGNHLIDNELTAVFDKIIRQLDGIYFARFDLKCKSIESLKKGENILIMEINGVGAEPAHIYDPKYSIWKTYKDLFKHWKIIFDVSRQNIYSGIRPMTLREMWKYYKEKSIYYKKLYK